MSWSNDTKGTGSYSNDSIGSSSYSYDVVGSGVWSSDSKGAGSYSNDTKPSLGVSETWASILTTWGTETRTWKEMVAEGDYSFDTI